MQTEITPRADLWVLAVALYKTSLSSVDDVSRWDRHAALFASHELENEKFIIGVSDQYTADYMASLYSEPLRIALIKAGAPQEVEVVFKVTEVARRIDDEKRQNEVRRQRNRRLRENPSLPRLFRSIPAIRSQTS